MRLWLLAAVVAASVSLAGAQASPPAPSGGGTPPVRPAGTPAATVVVLPFDNISGAQNAPREIAALFAKAIEAKGWQVVDSEKVEALLEEERVRYLDSIDDAIREKIGASAIVTGTLYTYVDGRTPAVAVAARMVRADGTLAWADLAAVSADDTVGLCGFGRKSSAAELAPVAIEKLAHLFPLPARGERVAEGRVRGTTRPIFLTKPLSFEANDLNPTARVCVLPIENATTIPEAARVITDILALRLGFEIVEPARLRAAALDAHIGSFRNIASADLAKLSKTLGTSLFLRGTVFDYDNGVEPRVDIELSLVDIESGRVLWTAQHERRGNDYVGFLMRGAVTNAVTLTDRVVSEMIPREKKHETKISRRPGTVAQRRASNR